MNFLNKYRRIFIVIGFLVAIGLIVFLLWMTFFAGPSPKITPPDKPDVVQPGILPPAEEGVGQIIDGEDGILVPSEKDFPAPEIVDKDIIARGGVTETVLLNENRSLDMNISSDGQQVQYYNRDDGKFYRVDENGKISLLSNTTFHEVENVNWSPDTFKAVLEYPDGSNIIYDFQTQRQVTLPKHWEEFDFSPNSQEIVAKSIGLDQDNRWLVTTNSDGSRMSVIEEIGINSDKVYTGWSPNQQVVALYVEGIDFDRQEVFFVGLNQENFKSTIIPGRGFQPKWSDEGDKLLYSVYSNSSNLKPNLWIVDASGESIGNNRKSLQIETWAEKCTFSGNSTVYCAVPVYLEEGSGIFPELAKNTEDYLYKIDIETGSRKLIAIPDGLHNMTNIVVSENEDTLYFTDNLTEQIYKIDLK